LCDCAGEQCACPEFVKLHRIGVKRLEGSMPRKTMTLLAGCVVMATIVVQSQSRGSRGAVVYEAARLIIGDGSGSIENGSMLVQNGRIVAVGRTGVVTVPDGATHVVFSGKTVIPGMVNVHVHIGYEGYTSWGAENYTPANVIDHLEREAFYGIVATQS